MKALDLTGQVFGRLTVENRNCVMKGTFWNCKCTCTTYVIVAAYKLTAGRKKSCGCLEREAKEARKLKLEGQRYGRLEVWSKHESSTSTKTYWLCKCDCGAMSVVNSASLRSGHTKSCGCLHKERAKTLNYKHGLTGIPEYEVWKGMIARCYNKNHKYYKNYGGRGIAVCSEWRDDFEKFYSDLGKRPYPEATIERIDNNSAYTKENVTWKSRKEQNRNRRDNVLLTLNGKTQCLSAWCEEYGMPYIPVWKRLGRGWDLERALTEPLHKKHGTNKS